MNDWINKCGSWWSVQLLTITCCACLASNGWAANASDMLKQLPLPRDATLTNVSDHSVHNGIAMTIAAFSATLSVEEVLSFYRQEWSETDKDTLAGFTESSTPGWLLISRLQEKHQVVIQLSTEPMPGASGFVSIMPLDEPLQGQDLGLFSSLVLLSSNISHDGADRSVMRVFASSSTVPVTHTRYRDKLVAQGWRLLMDAIVDDARIMIVTREASRLELSFLSSSEYASVLVAHEVQSK